MHSPERRALLLLLALAIAGQAVRHFATRPGEAAGGVQILSAFPPGSPTAHRDSTMRQASPLAPGERIDPDTASAFALARLPRVGLTLAKAIVSDREAKGPFGGMAGLDRVAGIGPGLLRTLEPYLTFGSGTPTAAIASAVHADNGTAFAFPPAGAANAPATGRRGAALNINQATAVELESLPGIGPSLARRIVAYREARGPFAAVQALDRVPGIGPALVARLRALVAAP